MQKHCGHFLLFHDSSIFDLLSSLQLQEVFILLTLVAFYCLHLHFLFLSHFIPFLNSRFFHFGLLFIILFLPFYSLILRFFQKVVPIFQLGLKLQAGHLMIACQSFPLRYLELKICWNFELAALFAVFPMGPGSRVIS